MFQNCTHPKLNFGMVAMADATHETQNHICRKAKACQGSLYCRGVCKCTTPQDHGKVFGFDYYETTVSFRQKPKAFEISWTASQYGKLSYVNPSSYFASIAIHITHGRKWLIWTQPDTHDHHAKHCDRLYDHVSGLGCEGIELKCCLQTKHQMAALNWPCLEDSHLLLGNSCG